MAKDSLQICSPLSWVTWPGTAPLPNTQVHTRAHTDTCAQTRAAQAAPAEGRVRSPWSACSYLGGRKLARLYSRALRVGGKTLRFSCSGDFC